MLTIEMLRQNTVLAGLPDSQLQAIAEMSRNDENTVIGTRIGALHGQYDTDIFGITGIKKNDGEKSYDYAKRVLNTYKGKVDSIKDIKAELSASKNQVTELQAKLAAGVADETLKQQLKDAKAQVSQLQTSLQAKETELTTKQAEFDKNIKDTHVSYAFQAATAGLKFKDGITESIQKTLLNAAKAEILAKGTPDFIDDGKGGQILVIRGQDGNILNNPKNNLNPYTIKELVMESSLKDALYVGQRRTGGGTGQGSNFGGDGGGTFDLSGAKTQVQADQAIEQHLLANGITRDSAEFAEQALKLRTENNVSDLPIR